MIMLTPYHIISNISRPIIAHTWNHAIAKNNFFYLPRLAAPKEELLGRIELACWNILSWNYNMIWQKYNLNYADEFDSW